MPAQGIAGRRGRIQAEIDLIIELLLYCGGLFCGLGLRLGLGLGCSLHLALSGRDLGWFGI